ncbi:MAG: class I SAM-dependent methyltransferase [Planctomycetota bacterium]
MSVEEWNRKAWNLEVERGNRWTVPVDTAAVAAAREGQWSVVLTPSKPVPANWFPDLRGCRVLGLAASGGQQAPILAAAGALVTVLDNSDKQLQQDRMVAERDGLKIDLKLGDMRDLGRFDDESFDLVFHPASNTYIPDVNPVWREAFRVLKPGGTLLSGFCNPLLWIFDDAKAEKEGQLEVRHPIPYSDLKHLTEAEIADLKERGLPLCFGHTLEDLIGGQLEAGFTIHGFYEDRSHEHPIDKFLDTMIATRAQKPNPEH